MVFSLEGRECRSPWGMTILSWLSEIFRGQVLGTPNGGYKVPGRVCPENPDSAATKFWALRTLKKKCENKTVQVVKSA